MGGGISTAWDWVWAFFANLPTTIKGWLINASVWLVQTGKDIIGSWGPKTGLIGGLHIAWDAVVTFFTELPGKVGGPIRYVQNKEDHETDS